VSKEIPELIAHIDYGLYESTIVRLVFDGKPDEEDRDTIKNEFKVCVETFTGERVSVGWKDECYMCDERDGEHHITCCEHPDFNPELCMCSDKKKKSDSTVAIGG
jgi:hypothetical protein